MTLIHPQVSLAPLTSYRVGGKAQWYASPSHWQELETCFDWLHTHHHPLTILGAGSNLLISDQGIPGLVMSTRHLRQVHFDLESGRLVAAAGEPLARLAWLAAKKGWHGLEWAVGIPGNLGGSVVMNAGAHNCSIADYLISIEVVNPRGEIQTLSCEQLDYGYRHSYLQNQQLLVIQATLQLQPGHSPPLVMATSSKNLQQRKTSQPYDKPSCGSVFRNPDPQKAGWLIEQTGLKGYQIGCAQVAHRHANFILNCGGATANDIFRLIRHVQWTVKDQWNINLQPEVKMIGDFPD